MRTQLFSGSVNLGKYGQHDFKEADSVGIAREIIERGRKCKTHFHEEDKVANFDGRISVLIGSIEHLIVEVQIKSLPSNTNTKSKFKYQCDTKIINCAKYRVSSNPIALIVVDRNEKRVFYKILTPGYIEVLNIGTQHTKTIKFDGDDEYEDDKFIKEVYRFAGVVYINENCIVHCDKIRKMIRKVHDVSAIPVYSTKMSDLDEENLVYESGNVFGYLRIFKVKIDEKRRYTISGFIKMYTNHGMIIEESYANLNYTRGLVRITRIPDYDTAISDTDFGNVALEIAKELEQDGIPVLYSSNGPKYWFEGVLMYNLHSELIDLPWDMRL